jgi:small-conductance mechanosensitive channel
MESYILRSTMTPQWLFKESEDRKASSAQQTSPALRELDKNRVLETRLKELNERFNTLQRSYKELLTRSGGDNYKEKYEELEMRHRREKEVLEKRIRTLEAELEQVRSLESAIMPAECTPIPASGELLFAQAEARDDTEAQLRELRERVEHAEARLLALEQV